MTAAPPGVPPVPSATHATPPDTRRRGLLALKLAVSALLLWWILRRTDLGVVLAAAGAADLGLLLLAYSTHVVGVLLSASRWRILLGAHGVKLRTGLLARSFLIASFFNNFLPSTVGGDAVRAYQGYRYGGNRGGAIAAVLVDRLLGLLALVVLALAALPFARELTGRLEGLPLWLGLGASLLVAAVVALFWGQGASGLDRLPPSFRGPLAKVLGAFAAYRGEGRVLRRTLGLSFLLQANVILYYFLVGQALHLPVPPSGYLLVVPLALVIMMLPITINGIGLREGAFVLFLAPYGVGSGEAVAYAWLVYLGGLLFSLCGGVLYATRR